MAFSTTISSDGLLWMGLTDDNLLYISTCRSITLWHTNQFLKFWALARNNVNKLYLSGAEDKTTRVVAVCDDSRYFTYLLWKQSITIPGILHIIKIENENGECVKETIT